jgi:hypothetical protein
MVVAAADEKEAAYLSQKVAPARYLTQHLHEVPVAYTLGTSFKPAARKPLASVLHWDRW